MERHTAKDWLQVTVWLVLLVFLLLGCMNYLSQLLSRPLPDGKTGPSSSELTTLFSGASSLALIIFSLLLAFAAIIGWQSLRHDVETVKKRAETILEETEKTHRLSVKRAQRLKTRLEGKVASLEGSMKKKNEEIEKELRGRLTAVMGLAIGTLHSNPTAKAQKEADEPYLVEAIHHSTQAYGQLEKVPGTSKYTALNNLVYFSSLLGVKSGQDKLLEQARELRDTGRMYRGPAAVPYLVTYARAVLAFSSDQDQIEDALGTIQEVTSMAGLSKLAEREALFVEDSLSAKLSSLAG